MTRIILRGVRIKMDDQNFPPDENKYSVLNEILSKLIEDGNVQSEHISNLEQGITTIGTIVGISGEVTLGRLLPVMKDYSSRLKELELFYKLAVYTLALDKDVGVHIALKELVLKLHKENEL